MAAAAAPLAAAASHRMKLHLSPGAIGVKANQEQMIDLAAKYGFEAVDADARYLASLSQADLDRLLSRMQQAKIVWGLSGLPVEFRRDEAVFRDGMLALPPLAKGLQRAGVTRVTTWLLPMHNELTYMQNFRQHARRLAEVARVLGDSGLRFGLEYVGPKTLWTSQRFPFLHTMAETKELIAEIKQPGVGFVLDSWHWWNAGESPADITGLKASDVVAVDLNDAPAGVPKDQQMDGKRELPAATGVIPVASFLAALREIGFDGPVRAEPFNQPLREMPPDAALKATVDALKKAFAL